MKVLQKGSERTFKKECHNCYSLLEYNMEDAKILERDFNGIINVSYYITCPICKAIIDVSRK
ncbi:MAG: hypothetical protein KQ78_01793 [Candidatus Izimaplasma bacterium HR2]|nr:MAG: hypothetical protein KQ78_01793 [Candidatus Izimaplasma bacterium HR2]